jgi:hypothetical protein
VVIETRILGSPPVRRLPVARHGNEHDAGERRRAADARGELVAIELGRADVEQHDVRVLIAYRREDCAAVVNRSI